MAPAAPPAMNVLQTWPLFTAFDTTGFPLIGGKLYSFAANTSVPKATYADPFLIVANTNPVVLDAMGQAMVYLDGFYRLLLTDREDIQRWEVDNYEFPSSAEPPVGGGIFGMTEGTATASSGESVLTVSNTAPLGYRVEGSLCRIETTFGTSLGLQQIAVGDSVLMDAWGVIGLDAGLTTIQKDFRSAERPIAATSYTVLLSALGGRFDSAGACTIRTYWSAIGGWA